MPVENDPQPPVEDTGGRVIERTERVVERPAPTEPDPQVEQAEGTGNGGDEDN